MTFFNNSPANGWRFLKFFIFSSEYKKLGDAQLDRYVLAMRILFAVCAIGFVIGIGVVGTASHAGHH